MLMVLWNGLIYCISYPLSRWCCITRQNWHNSIIFLGVEYFMSFPGVIAGSVTVNTQAIYKWRKFGWKTQQPSRISPDWAAGCRWCGWAGLIWVGLPLTPWTQLCPPAGASWETKLPGAPHGFRSVACILDVFSWWESKHKQKCLSALLFPPKI